MIRAICFSLVVFLAALAPAHAVMPDEVLTDQKLEARARALSAELRCMVCQNQSIDDSDAPLARDLRILVRERLKAGDSDAAIRAFLTRRYGDFILLKPRLKLETALLWMGPAALLLIGASVIVFWTARRRSGGLGRDDLTGEERAALEALLSAPERSDPTTS
ncbi:MAG: cytochrome c-type biogenesis protein CcmH [Beijerinckiaceae bacterium]